MRKKALLIMLLISFCCLLLPAQIALAEGEIELNCTSAVLLDGSSSAVLFSQNSTEPCFPASVTKIMTMVLILEAVDAGTIHLEDMVSVSKAAAGMGGSQVYLYEGETRTVQEMLVAIAVGSGNDASYAMAEFVGGSYDNFIQQMNARAQELGMSGTNFANPHGLHDENHYTTAEDLGKLAYHALSVPNFLEYTSIYEYEFRPEPNLLTLWNTNRLLKWYEGTDGMKTDYTEEAGRNLVATVERDGMRLISVVLNCKERQGHFQESMDLLNYGFNSFEYVQLYKKGDVVCQTEVSKGVTERVNLLAAKDVGYLTKKNETAAVTESIQMSKSLMAPVAANTPAGTLTIFREGRELMVVELVTATEVKKGGLFRTWGKLLNAIL